MLTLLVCVLARIGEIRRKSPTFARGAEKNVGDKSTPSYEEATCQDQGQPCQRRTPINLAPTFASKAYRTILGGHWECEANSCAIVYEEDDILFSKTLVQ